jgi:hypothetical protein
MKCIYEKMFLRNILYIIYYIVDNKKKDRVVSNKMICTNIFLLIFWYNNTGSNILKPRAIASSLSRARTLILFQCRFYLSP